MVTVIAAFVQAKKVVLFELLGVLFACLCAASIVGRGAVFGVIAVALLAKSFEWDLTGPKDGGG